MKNRNCPNKDACWDYDASNCGGCAVGQKFEEYIRKIKRLQAENAELRERLDKAVELPLLQTIRGNKLPYEVAYKDNNGRIIVTKYRRWQKKQAEARLKDLQNN